MNELVKEVRDLIKAGYDAAGQSLPEIDDHRIERALSRQGIHFAEHAERFSEIAPAGPDGQKAIQLLAHAKKSVTATLGGLTKKALARHLTSGNHIAGSLFNEDERQELAQAIAETTATAELLGRARVRRRQEQAERQHGVTNFSEEPTDFSCFKEKEPLRPMKPVKALEYFRRLVPRLNIEANGFNGHIEQEAFRMALATDDRMRERVQEIIGEILESGQGVSAAPRQINEILGRAGVHPTNPQYTENIVRSNLMNSYNRGWQEEMKEPDVAEAFPVWKWLGIRDGRQRPSHEVHFDKYFPAGTTFEKVRDSVKGSYDGFNDRCTGQPIYKADWERLLSQGANVERFAEEFDPEKHPRGGYPENKGEFSKGRGKQATTKPTAKPAGHPGAQHGSSVTIKKSKQRAFDGATPVKTKITLTKQETGRVGEAVALAYLKTVLGRKDAAPMNKELTNFPIDLLEDHAPTEVKAGLVSNAPDAQKWRLTFSQESKKEKELYATMTHDQRETWNATKQQRIQERKEAVIRGLEKATGKKIKPRTITLVINPDTRTADVYIFDGFHPIIRWRSEEAKKAYQGSVTYA